MRKEKDIMESKAEQSRIKKTQIDGGVRKDSLDKGTY